MAGGQTVLVVDDEASIRFLCKVNLELEGYSVLEAESLDEAREHLRDAPVDVVLLDVHVGHGDGRELLREIRAGTRAIPVAFFTGSAEMETLRHDGADALIPKPFLLEDLLATVQGLTGSTPA